MLALYSDLFKIVTIDYHHRWNCLAQAEEAKLVRRATNDRRKYKTASCTLIAAAMERICAAICILEGKAQREYLLYTHDNILLSLFVSYGCSVSALYKLPQLIITIDGIGRHSRCKTSEKSNR